MHHFKGIFIDNFEVKMNNFEQIIKWLKHKKKHKYWDNFCFEKHVEVKEYDIHFNYNYVCFSVHYGGFRNWNVIFNSDYCYSKRHDRITNIGQSLWLPYEENVLRYLKQKIQLYGYE